MEKVVYREQDRGKASYGWLTARYSFSFANYYNPENVHFGMLRVLNDDIIQPGMGFDTHPHDNMEIITIPLRGALRHKDSMGHESVINAGEVQVMSAGTGITHSEFNASDKEEINLLQIWIFPNKRGAEPRYDQKAFSPDIKNRFQLLVSPDGRDESLWINQNAFISLVQIDEIRTLSYQKFDEANGLYFFQIEGRSIIADEKITERDAISIKQGNDVELRAETKSWILVLEVPV